MTNLAKLTRCNLPLRSSTLLAAHTSHTRPLAARPSWEVWAARLSRRLRGDSVISDKGATYQPSSDHTPTVPHLAKRPLSAETAVAHDSRDGSPGSYKEPNLPT